MEKEPKTAGAVIPINQPGAIAETSARPYYDMWIEYLDISNPATLKTYRKAIKQFANAFGGINPAAITARQIKDWRDGLSANHKPATVQLYMVAIRRFYSWLEAESQGRLHNPAQGLKGAKLDHAHKKDYLTAAQAHAVLAGISATTLKGKRDKAIAALMLTAGLRTIEVIRADIADLRPLGAKTVLYVQGKGHSEKADFVEVTPKVEGLIRDYLATRKETSGPLFASRNHSGRMATGSISRICKWAMRAAGLNSDRLTAHSFRHTAATLSLLGGRTLPEVQQLLRHININTTMIYQHAIDKANNRCAETVSDMIM